MKLTISKNRTCKRLLIVCCSAIYILLIILIACKKFEKNVIQTSVREMDISCYEEESDKQSLELFDQNVTDENSIFFYETSCFGTSEATLNARQACAIESAAKMNPNRTVYLLYLTPSKPSFDTMLLHEYLTRYQNVKIRRIMVNKFFKDTPLEQMYINGVLKTSPWAAIKMSDFLRYLTLWKYGGIYLDLDVVVLKSMDNLTNFVGAQDEYNVAAGVMGFSKFGLGHQIATECLSHLVQNFKGDDWSGSGPGVITKTLQKICKVQSIKNMTLEKCKGFSVFPPYAFYPIPYQNWERYFETKDAESTVQLFKDAYAIHVWNKLSKNRSIRLNEKLPYTLVAEKYCPAIYLNCAYTF